MKTCVYKVFSICLMSFVLAVIACLRWTTVVSSWASVDENPQDALTLVAKLVPIFLAVSVAMACFAWRSTFLLTAFAVVAGSVVFYVLQSIISVIAEVSGHISILFAALFIVLAAYAAKRKPLVSGLSLVSLINIIPHIVVMLFPSSTSKLSVALYFGDHVAQSAAQFMRPPHVSYWIILTFLVGSMCALISIIWALLHKQDIASGIVRAILLGLITGLVVSGLQLLLFTITLISGLDTSIVMLSVPLVCALMSLLTLVATSAIRNGSKYILIKTLPLIATGLLIILVGVSFYGSGDYYRLDSSFEDSTWVYIHFNSSGGWRRTLDSTCDSTKRWRTQRFIVTYPYSVYRSSALLKLAEYYYDAWQFEEASNVLSQLQCEYPYLRSRCRILQSLVDLSRGKTTTILSSSSEAELFDKWRREQGAQLAAYAAERSGQPVRSLGYISYYIDYLNHRNPASWTSASLLNAHKHADRALSRRLSSYGGETATATFSVTAETQPLKGARIILVQQHFDAALPKDSRQFTGARTISAWNGCWGITDDDGRVTIENIPCGTYEVVLGVDHRVCSPKYVVSKPVSPLTLKAGEKPHTEIRLLPRVELVSPSNGELLRPTSPLRWRDYPGAASYSVCIIAMPQTIDSGTSVAVASRKKTCWAKSGIVACETDIEAGCFTNGTDSLDPGKLYMWIVYAYGADGTILSSSEHYFNLGEPVFSVR